MTLKLVAPASRAKSFAIALAIGAAAAMAINVPTADAAPKKRERVAVRSNGPNYSYQAGPRTRVYISRRSWLDAGTQVLPGERKFTDYAYPPGYHYGRSIDRVYQGRQPLNDQWDLGGFPEAFPLY